MITEERWIVYSPNAPGWKREGTEAWCRAVQKNESKGDDRFGPWIVERQVREVTEWKTI